MNAHPTPRPPSRPIARKTLGRQLGSAMVEFVLVAPVMTLIGTAILQYSLLFNAKNLVNHASFMAVRAGSMANANLGTVESAYTRALIPLYGGGRDSAELAASYAKAVADVAGNAKIEMLNPAKQSFDDYNDAKLQTKYSARAIPNGNQYGKTAAISSASGQSIQDANLLKIKITHGYTPKIPVVGPALQYIMRVTDNGTDAFTTALYNKGRIPIVTHIMVHMQSDAVEPQSPVQIAGAGTNGAPSTPPADPPSVPPCTSCENAPPPPSSGVDVASGASTCTAAGAAPGTQNILTTLSADTNFAFGSNVLSNAGKTNLDQLAAQAANRSYDSIAIDGYTDTQGDSTGFDNLGLSQRRADAVKAYLVSKGINSSVITATGHGSSDPVCTDQNPSAACYAQNRRVTVVVKNVSST